MAKTPNGAILVNDPKRTDAPSCQFLRPDLWTNNWRRQYLTYLQKFEEAISPAAPSYFQMSDVDPTGRRVTTVRFKPNTYYLQRAEAVAALKFQCAADRCGAFEVTYCSTKGNKHPDCKNAQAPSHAPYWTGRTFSQGDANDFYRFTSPGSRSNSLCARGAAPSVTRPAYPLIKSGCFTAGTDETDDMHCRTAKDAPSCKNINDKWGANCLWQKKGEVKIHNASNCGADTPNRDFAFSIDTGYVTDEEDLATTCCVNNSRLRYVHGFNLLKTLADSASPPAPLPVRGYCTHSSYSTTNVFDLPARDWRGVCPLSGSTAVPFVGFGPAVPTPDEMVKPFPAEQFQHHSGCCIKPADKVLPLHTGVISGYAVPGTDTPPRVGLSANGPAPFACSPRCNGSDAACCKMGSDGKICRGLETDAFLGSFFLTPEECFVQCARDERCAAFSARKATTSSDDTPTCYLFSSCRSDDGAPALAPAEEAYRCGFSTCNTCEKCCDYSVEAGGRRRHKYTFDGDYEASSDTLCYVCAMAPIKSPVAYRAPLYAPGHFVDKDGEPLTDRSMAGGCGGAPIEDNESASWKSYAVNRREETFALPQCSQARAATWPGDAGGNALLCLHGGEPLGVACTMAHTGRKGQCVDTHGNVVALPNRPVLAPLDHGVKCAPTCPGECVPAALGDRQACDQYADAPACGEASCRWLTNEVDGSCVVALEPAQRSAATARGCAVLCENQFGLDACTTIAFNASTGDCQMVLRNETCVHAPAPSTWAKYHVGPASALPSGYAPYSREASELCIAIDATNRWVPALSSEQKGVCRCTYPFFSSAPSGTAQCVYVESPAPLAPSAPTCGPYSAATLGVNERETVCSGAEASAPKCTGGACAPFKGNAYAGPQCCLLKPFPTYRRHAPSCVPEWHRQRRECATCIAGATEACNTCLKYYGAPSCRSAAYTYKGYHIGSICDSADTITSECAKVPFRGNAGNAKTENEKVVGYICDESNVSPLQIGNAGLVYPECGVEASSGADCALDGGGPGAPRCGSRAPFLYKRPSKSTTIRQCCVKTQQLPRPCAPAFRRCAPGGRPVGCGGGGGDGDGRGSCTCDCSAVCKHNGVFHGDAATCAVTKEKGCVCPTGYEGLYCEVPAPCTTAWPVEGAQAPGTIACENGGTADGRTGACTCRCPDGFMGTTCAARAPCKMGDRGRADEIACQNGGVPRGKAGSCWCLCPSTGMVDGVSGKAFTRAGFTGTYCEIPLPCVVGVPAAPAFGVVDCGGTSEFPNGAARGVTGQCSCDCDPELNVYGSRCQHDTENCTENCTHYCISFAPHQKWTDNDDAAGPGTDARCIGRNVECDKKHPIAVYPSKEKFNGPACDPKAPAQKWEVCERAFVDPLQKYAWSESPSYLSAPSRQIRETFCFPNASPNSPSYWSTRGVCCNPNRPEEPFTTVPNPLRAFYSFIEPGSPGGSAPALWSRCAPKGGSLITMRQFKHDAMSHIDVSCASGAAPCSVNDDGVCPPGQVLSSAAPAAPGLAPQPWKKLGRVVTRAECYAYETPAMAPAMRSAYFLPCDKDFCEDEAVAVLIAPASAHHHDARICADKATINEILKNFPYVAPAGAAAPAYVQFRQTEHEYACVPLNHLTATRYTACNCRAFTEYVKQKKIQGCVADDAQCLRTVATECKGAAPGPCLPSVASYPGTWPTVFAPAASADHYAFFKPSQHALCACNPGKDSVEYDLGAPPFAPMATTYDQEQLLQTCRGFPYYPKTCSAPGTMSRHEVDGELSKLFPLYGPGTVLPATLQPLLHKLKLQTDEEENCSSPEPSLNAPRKPLTEPHRPVQTLNQLMYRWPVFPALGSTYGSGNDPAAVSLLSRSSVHSASSVCPRQTLLPAPVELALLPTPSGDGGSCLFSAPRNTARSGAADGFCEGFFGSCADGGTCLFSAPRDTRGDGGGSYGLGTDGGDGSSFSVLLAPQNTPGGGDGSSFSVLLAPQNTPGDGDGSSFSVRSAPRKMPGDGAFGVDTTCSVSAPHARGGGGYFCAAMCSVSAPQDTVSLVAG